MKNRIFTQRVAIRVFAYAVGRGRRRIGMRWRLALMLAPAVGVSLAPIRSDAQNQSAALMRQLESTDWRRRAVAFTAIDRDPRAWEQPRSALSLLKLVERERALQKETLLSSNGAVGASDRFGEEYSEYAARALDECLRYCDRDKLLTMIVNDARSGPTRHSAIELLGNTYNRVWTTLSRRLRIDSTLVAATSDRSSWLVRAAAVSALSAPVRAWSDLPTQERERIRGAIIEAARDSSGPVRESAVRRLGELEKLPDNSSSPESNSASPRQLVEFRLVRESLVYVVATSPAAATKNSIHACQPVRNWQHPRRLITAFIATRLSLATPPSSRQ